MDLLERTENIAGWMNGVDLKSGDPFALQCSDIGVKVGKISPLKVGYAFSQIDQRFPWFSNAAISHKVAPISAGIYVQACVLLSKHTQSPFYSARIEQYLDWLEEHANKKYPYTWGIPFKWLMGTGVLAPENTPMSTVTPYCSDAFYLNNRIDVGLSGAYFILNDLNVVYEKGDKLAVSYSPLDDFQIINVQAYCAAQLYRAYIHTNEPRYKETADKLINFVLSEQNEDGSWYYWSKHQPVNLTIDSLHQCYIMQGLYRCYLFNGDQRIKESVDRCMSYCKEKLITEDLYVKKFPSDKLPYRKHPYELIDAAEMISTLDMIEDPLSNELLEKTIDRFSIKNKPSFGNNKWGIPEEGISRYFASWLNPRNNIPYIRWGQSQMLFAMAQHLVLSTKTMTVKEIYL